MRILHITRLVAAPLLLLALLTPVSAASMHDLAADAGSAMTPATTANSASALYALEAAVDTRDEDGVVALFTADAHVFDGAVYLGADGVRDWTRAALADDAWLELIDDPAVGPTSGQPLVGDWAVAPVTFSRVPYRELGVDPMLATFVAIIQDSRIAYLSIRSDTLWRRDLQKAQAAQLMPCPRCIP
jgi:2-polyprenyl-6-methoxyphenol hydroxylase-like FAD-dependent oxidoreductase